MTDQKVQRINELYKKQKTVGLTPAEKEEQQMLRAEYVASFRKNLKSMMENIKVQDEDGNVRPLKK